jgi:acetyl-CoA carboxylase carboxyltransferase component
MGAQQATNTLLDVMVASLKKQGHVADAEELTQLRAQVAGDYQRQMDVRYAAARLWVDAIIMPRETRQVLIQALEVVTRHPTDEPYRLGVFQV